MAIPYLKLTPVKKAGTPIGKKLIGGTVGRGAHHSGTKLTHGAGGRAAYLSGHRIENEIGIVTDYRDKFGVEHDELVLPGGGTCDREKFWNSVDAHKTQKETADVAYDFIVALPHEFSREERKHVSRELAVWVADRYQVAVDYGIHIPETHKGSDERNFHVHYLISARKVNERGELGFVQRDLNHRVCTQIDVRRGRTNRKPTAVQEIRDAWQRTASDALERGGYADRVDMRSYKKQGLNKNGGRHLGAEETRLKREAESSIRFKSKSVRAIGRELSEKAHAIADDRMKALGTIIEIQNSRKIEPASPQVAADIGSIDAWNKDAAGMLSRYWRAEDRAMQLRRKLRNAARRHADLREATKEENTRLRAAGRVLTRSESLLREAEKTINKLENVKTLDMESRDGRLTQSRIREINSAIRDADKIKETER